MIPDNLPSHALRVSPKDTLLCSLISKDAAYDGLIRALIMLDDGEIIPIADIILATGSWTKDTKQIPLTDGWLISVSVKSAAAPDPGGAFAIVELARQETADNLGQIALVHGYLSTNRSVSWPGVSPTSSLDAGPYPDHIAVTDPAAGAGITYTIPTNRVIHLEAIHFKLVTDANAASRQVQLIIDTGSSSLFIWRRFCSVTQAASLTRYYNAGFGETADAEVSDNITMPYPPLSLIGGWRMLLTISNIQVGDQVSGFKVKGRVQIFS